MKLATNAGQTLTKVTRDKATALIGDSLRDGLKKGGEHGDRAWQAIAEMPDGAQDAALGWVVDDLEQAGFALLEVRDRPE